jgi:hypothetical protein
MWNGLALTLQAYRHLPEADTLAETQPIAATLEANTYLLVDEHGLC